MILYAVLILCSISVISTNQQKSPTAVVFPASNEDKTLPLLYLPIQPVKVDKVEEENVGSKSCYKMASEAVHGVATRLHSLLDPTGSKNYVVSPLSIAVVVAQLLLGAKGKSQQRMRDLLSTSKVPLNDASADAAEQELHKQLGGLVQYLQVAVEPTTENPDDEAEGNFYQLRAASAFFLQKDLELNKNYYLAIRALYNSDFQALDFKKDPLGAYRAINRWGSDNTNGLISDILPRPLPASTAVLLVNSIYFRADWETPFSTLLTSRGPFKLNTTHLIDVRYMRGQFEIKYTENLELGCKMIVLPYKQKDVNMYIVLPNPSILDVKEFSTKITPQNITNLINSTVDSTVTLVMPKMKLKSSFSLKDPIMNYRPTKRVDYSEGENLKAAPRNRTLTTTQRVPTSSVKPNKQKPVKPTTAGSVNKNSNNGFDLSGASSDPRFVVHDIRHEVTLEVSETGTEAAAVSIGSVDYSGDIRSMKLERPFLFFIRHEESEVNLFWGVVMDPTNGDWP